MAIITMPTTPAFRSSEFGLDFNTDIYANPQTRQIQTVERAGARWRAKYRLPPMRRDQLAQWQAFLANLNGQTNTFLGYDPDGLTPRGSNPQEPPSTNFVRNIAMAGAVVGTATLPSSVGISLSSGLTRQVVGQGIEDGIPYIDVRISGTATDTSYQVSHGCFAVGGTVGDRVVYSGCVRRIAGTTPASGVFLNLREATGAFPGSSVNMTTALELPSLALTRRSVSRITTLTANSFNARVQVSFSVGNTIDFTFRYGGLQLEHLRLTPTALMITNNAAANVRPDGKSVYGAGQTGSSLRVRGFTANTANVLLAGDYIGVAGKMYMLTAPASSDVEGAAVLSITPMLPSSPADGAAVATTNVSCEMRLADAGQAQWKTNHNGVCDGLTFDAVEAL